MIVTIQINELELELEQTDGLNGWMDGWMDG